MRKGEKSAMKQVDEELFQEWKQRLHGRYGNYFLDELQQILPSFHRQKLDVFVDWIESHDDLYVRKSTNSRQAKITVFIKTPGEEDTGIYGKYGGQFDGDEKEVFERLVAEGKRPSTAAAAIEYVTTDKTQKEIADEYGTTHVSIRNNIEAVADHIDIPPNAYREKSSSGYGDKEKVSTAIFERDSAEIRKLVDDNVFRSVSAGVREMVRLGLEHRGDDQ